MNRPGPDRPAPLFASLLSLVALTACSGGGGAAGTPDPDPRLDEGSYTVDDFPAPDPRPVGFQPLGTAGFQALSRDELFAVLPLADGESRSFRMQDDPAAGSADIPEIQRLFLGEGTVHAATFAQLDQDADDELLVATVDSTETRIDLHRVERGPGGALVRDFLRSLPAQPFSFEDLRLTAADLDGDARDEICVAARGETWGNATSGCAAWVLDDPDGASDPLFTFTRSARHISLEVLPMDADGDGRLELVLGLGGDTTDDGRYAVRMYSWNADAAAFDAVHGWQYLHGTRNYDQSRAVAGDFDRNGTDDLAFVGERATLTASYLDLRVHEFVPGGTWQMFTSYAIVDVSAAASVGYVDWTVAAFRPTLRGHELALVARNRSDRTLYRGRYDRGNDSWDFDSTRIDRLTSNQSVALVAGDFDADGQEELQVALVAHPSGGSRLDLGFVDHDDSGLMLTWQTPIVLGPASPASSRNRFAVLAAGDFDADGIAVEYTGRSELRLADPIPLVVLAAAPTQAGISQNYENTESSYSTGNTRGTSIGVSTYSSITYSTGASFDLFGALGVEGRASIERGLQRTSTNTRQETIVQGYRGSHDHDVIVFQGTLYETFEYRILSAPDPAAVGTLMTLDLPIDANTYKWTVDYYNRQVDAADRIGPDLLTHTPGDLASYPSRAELQGLIGDEMHWDLPGSRPVGQGTASDFQSVSFETAQATEEERTITRSYGGGASFGVSVSADRTNAEGATHEVFYAQETSFEASVGDIAEPADYAAWQYDWGFSIHTVGRGSQGYGDRKHSFQYLRYWVEPKGSNR